MANYIDPPRLSVNQAAPLAVVVTATTDRDVALTVCYGDGDRHREITGPFGTEHRLTLIGMRADRTIDIAVSGDALEIVTLHHHTPPLPPPAAFPSLRISTSDEPRAESQGSLLLSVCMRVPDPPQLPAEDSTFGLLIAVDDHGDVVWWFTCPHIFGIVLPLENGGLLLGANNGEAFEIDWEGTISRWWRSRAGRSHIAEAIERDPSYASNVPEPIEIDTQCVHHGWRELGDGQFLALSVTAQQVAGFPDPPEDPSLRGPRPLPPAADPPWVVADEIIEFDATSGTVTSRISTFDLLDVERVSHDYFIPFWSMVGAYPVPEFGATRDWSHGSGIAHDPESDLLVVTFRHLDVIAGIDRASKELRWLLGDPTGWRDPWASKLLDPGDDEIEWAYHMHSPIITDSKPGGPMRVMVFDNGLRRAIYPDPGLAPSESFSRAVEFEIDEAAGTVRMAWEWRGEESFLSTVVSSVHCRSEDRRVVVTDGMRPRNERGERVYTPGGHPCDGVVTVVDRDSDSSELEMLVEAHGDDGLLGWAVYQSVMVPDRVVRDHPR